MKYLFLILGMLPLFGQTDLYLPWVPQNDIFHSSLIFNNHTDEDVIIHLRAARNATEIEETTMTLTPRINYKAAADEIFPMLGMGSGYAVQISSDAKYISASIIISSTTTASGNSPSRMKAISLEKASKILGFNYLPSGNGGFAAPVVMNVGPIGTSVTFHGFQNGQEVGSFTRFILPGEPFTREITQLFSGEPGEFYVIAEAHQPIVGSSFLFNEFREPAMAPANAVAVVPNPKEAIREFELDGASNDTTMHIDESIQLQLTGHFIQGPSRDLTQEATWTSSNPDLLSVSNASATKGLITAVGYGSAIITANYNDFSETVAIETIGPTIMLERGVDCSQDPTICASWEPLTDMAALPDERMLEFIGFDPLPLETLRISSDDSAIIISEVSTRNFQVSVPLSISGLSVGQRIPKGTSQIFFLEAGRTSGPEAEIIYTIKVEGSGTVLQYSLRYSSN